MEKRHRKVQEMFESCKEAVRYVVGVTEELRVEVGVHQGSAP